MRNVAVKRNRYVDSVTLMTIEEKVMKLSGVENVEVKMGTPANKEVFEGAGYNIEENVQNNDLVIAITGDADEVVAGAIKLVEDILDRRVDDEDTVIYSSLDEIDMQTDPYDLVQISLPGEFAFDEAMKALEKNLDVFIFSDNVSIEEELELKRFGFGKRPAGHGAGLRRRFNKRGGAGCRKYHQEGPHRYCRCVRKRCSGSFMYY